MKNPLVEKYGADKRWVNWKLEERKGKQTKIPYTPGKNKMASSTDEKTWAAHEVAAAASKNIGIVFTPEKKLLGIDLDHCINGDKVEHKEKKAIRALLESANTYTELSPSGTGLHLYFDLSEPLKLDANRHENYEAYTEGRYFTVTGRSFGVVKDVRTITTEEALSLLTIIGYPWKKKKTTSFEDLDGKERPKAKQPLIDNPSDILKKMFKASNGPEIKALYEGDVSAYAGDASRADMAFLSHLAFWTAKDAAAMESIWLSSPIGKRQKTQEREDYRRRSIENAIEQCTTVYNPDAHFGESETDIGDKKLGLLYALKDKRRIYYKNTENITRVILKHPMFEGTFRFDEYRDIIDRRVNGVWRNLQDHDVIDIQTRISVLFSDFANIGKEMTFDAVVNAAYTNKVDTGADYLKGLTWDKEKRLDSWISKAFHTPDDHYHQSIGANWLKGMVKRVIQPGCKFDYVLVLEGEQGIKKSTALLTLAGELGHVETTMSTETKDFFMQFLGNAIVEFSEGETLSRTEVKRMKAIITVQIDKFRAPYGRSVVPHPRRCVFSMTTNQTEYLKDETGNRRWLPVAVNGLVDLKWIEDNREQILAEAYYRVVKGETTWEFPEEEMQLQQNMRRIQDPNADSVVNWYMQGLSESKRDEGITLDQAFREALNSGFGGPMSRQIEMGLADILRTVLLLEKRRGMIGGIRQTRWYPSKQTLKDISLVEASKLF